MPRWFTLLVGTILVFPVSNGALKADAPAAPVAQPAGSAKKDLLKAADPESHFQNVLAVQRAMEQARFFLVQPDAKKAVDVLEAQLPRINGNANFLRMLRDAYRKHIQDLWLNNENVLARKYLDRLCIIDPGAAHDPIFNGEAAAKAARAATAPKITPPATGLAALPFFNNFQKKQPTIRAQQQEDDPFDPRYQKKDTLTQQMPMGGAAPSTMAAPAAKTPATQGGEMTLTAQDNSQTTPAAVNNQAAQFVGQAEQEFSQRRFAEARVLYEKAYQTDPQATASCRDRWAYCLLNHVVEKLNQPNLGGNTPGDLEKIVRGAVSMSPNLQDTGKWLLREIDLRHPAQLTANGPRDLPQQTLQIQHLGKNSLGWQVAETEHFRIFHNQPLDRVEQIARVAEHTRVQMFQKWFGSEVAWTPKCDLFLHDTAADYSRRTGVPSSSPGHSRIETDPSNQRVVHRRMDMHVDHPGMLETVLPHETTHVVLAGMYGPFAVPRWADEGVAVLTEPTDRVEEHRRNLLRNHRQGKLYRVGDLMNLQDYPEPRRISAFYAQSVFLVEFLARQKGPRVFSEFMRDGLREGYDSALRRHYGWTMNDLEAHFQQHVLGESQRFAGGNFNR